MQEMISCKATLSRDPVVRPIQPCDILAIARADRGMLQNSLWCECTRPVAANTCTCAVGKRVPAYPERLSPPHCRSCASGIEYSVRNSPHPEGSQSIRLASPSQVSRRVRGSHSSLLPCTDVNSAQQDTDFAALERRGHDVVVCRLPCRGLPRVRVPAACAVTEDGPDQVGHLQAAVGDGQVHAAAAQVPGGAPEQGLCFQA